MSQIKGSDYAGELYSLQKKDNNFSYCKESVRKLVISSNEIKDISAFEQFVFKIDHKKEEGKIKFFFNSKTEKDYYSIEMVDRKNKIYKVKLNQNPETYFINKDNITSIKQINCEPKDQAYQLKNLSKVFDFNLEASEYESEKEKEYPTAIWITINKKDNQKWEKEIRFEPVSWSMFKNIPNKYFIVNDFNFDGLEDFAIVTNFGKEALYSYFLQDKKEDFIEDEKFPLQGKAFPFDINRNSKTIILKSTVGCCKINTLSYHLNDNGKWDEKSIQEDVK